MKKSKNVRRGSRYVVTATPIAVSLLAVLTASAEGNGQLRGSDTATASSVKVVSSCADDGGTQTLRGAVMAAESGDTIDLSNLDCGTITLQTGQIEIHADDLTILGPGQEALEIDGAYHGRVLHHSGAGTLTLQGVTVRHGLADAQAENPNISLAGSGGCILSDYGSGTLLPRDGGVRLIDTAVTECRAFSDAPPTPVFGGAVSATGTVELQSSRVTDSRAVATNGGTTWAGGAGGGGIAAIYGVVNLVDSVVSGNSVEAVNGKVAGGGVYVLSWQGSSTEASGIFSVNSVVDNNFAGCPSTNNECAVDVIALGGGLFVDGKPLTMTLSTVSNNSVRGTLQSAGGGIWSGRGGIDLHETTVSSNVASTLNQSIEAIGGGVFVTEGGALVTASTIDNNVGGRGGGIATDWTTLSTFNSTISSNHAEEGSAIFNGPGSGALEISAKPMLLVSSTITANICSGQPGIAGGAVLDMHSNYISDGVSRFESSIIAGNTNAWPSGSEADVVVFSRVEGSNNLISPSGPNPYLPPDTLMYPPELGPLQDNGGPTRTHALLWSVAINAGNNYAGLAFDQRGDGHARVVDGAPDIGAYERSSEENTPPDPDIIFWSLGFD